ncbi:MAG: DPP IV N-terminal domain-containing protein [Bacteroidota bacterium]
MRKFICASVLAFYFVSAAAQQANIVTTKNYELAESRLLYNTEPLVDNNFNGRPNWLPGDRFWYRVLYAQGSAFILINPATGTRGAAFDHQKMAAALSAATGNTYNANMLPFQTFTYSAGEKSISFQADEKQWTCDLQTYTCKPDAGHVKKSNGHRATTEVVSPDAKKAIFIKDYNLWMRDLASNAETQLTTDGIKDFGYATDNAGWKTSDKPILLWSPDSRKIATYKQDQRNVSDMYLVGTNVGKPTLRSWKYPLPGDKDIITIQRIIINVDTPKIILLQIQPDPRRGTLCDDISCGGTGFDDVDWNADASQLAFVSTSRDHKQEKFRIANAVTGAIREIFDETVATQFESGRGSINWRYLDKTNEVIWYSERDNWGHLYLYDAQTGKLKNQITKGEWVVTKLIKVDERKRQLCFMAAGRETGNPYFSHLYRIGFDGKNLVSLTPEDGNHTLSLSPSGNYFTDTYSKPDLAPVAVFRNIDGKIVSNIEKTDLSRLRATGWKAPTPVTLKAHDGKTDLYGLMFVPTNLDASKKYPVVDYIYPGPQGGSVGSWSFASARNDNQALAELGFTVVAIEGTGNPFRSKSFHDMSYGDMSENTLPDQISGIRQLAQKFNYIDTNRVGIWGHSGGGFATASAMFKYPDFFKVGIAESGNHDNRNYEDDWGERYDGLLTMQADGVSNYEAQANENYAKNLKGKLMLAHGMMDNNVPPSNTMLVVEALEKANKNFDLVIFPNSPHGYGNYSSYMMRRRWDYFVRNLAGAEPPMEYLIRIKADPRNAGIGN